MAGEGSGYLRNRKKGLLEPCRNYLFCTDLWEREDGGKWSCSGTWKPPNASRNGEGNLSAEEAALIKGKLETRGLQPEFLKGFCAGIGFFLKGKEMALEDKT